MKTVKRSKQSIFIQEYMVDRNATQAAIRAGYSERSASQIANKLLNKDEIKKELELRNQEVTNRLGITRDHVLQEIARIAFIDPRKLYGVDGQLKSIHELDDDTAAALAQIESIDEYDDEGEKIGTNKKVKLWSKEKGLEMLAKYFKLYSDAPVNAFQFNNVQVTKEELNEAKQLFDEKY